MRAEAVVSQKPERADLRDPKEKRLSIALAGNPNSGKTTIFNAMTGARQRVGNWGGVTVERKEGTTQQDGYTFDVVDLPGTYSLTAYSLEEIIARDYIVEDHPDVVIDIVDATNLERNLYLAVQLIELGVKAVIALNMSDEAERQGIKIDKKKLGELLGIPIVRTVGTKREGIQELLATTIQVAEDREPTAHPIHVDYGREVEEEIRKIQARIGDNDSLAQKYSLQWLAVKLLENDREMRKLVSRQGGEDILRQVEESTQHLRRIFEEDPETVIADHRYGFIAGACRETVHRISEDRMVFSEKVDKVLTNRLLGFPILTALLWVMFQLTFKVGAYPMEWIDAGVGWLSDLIGGYMADGLLKDLIVDGILAGVGGVLVFLPNIMILFLCISFFEDTGYMARAAFIMDRVMHTIGLHGKSFIPMIMGFGCNVPAIMATRTLESRRDRILTILINPLISCSARLPIYVLLAGAFFARSAGNVIFSIYIIGIVLAVLMGQVFKRLFFRGEIAPFVMELPPYRIPTLRGTLIHMWERGSIFLKRMGTVILVGAILIWLLSSFPRNVTFSRDYDGEIQALETSYGARIASAASTQEAARLEEERDARMGELEVLREAERQEKSYLGRLGKILAPVVRPLGFGWREGVALVTGFVAKEIVVSTLGVLYQVGTEEGEESESLRQALRRSGMTPLTAYAFMIFTLIYTPCLATVAVIRRETGSWGWTVFSVGYGLVLAWVLAFLVYRGGRLLGVG